MFVVATERASDAIISKLATDGIPAWVAGRVTIGARDLTGFEQGAKGVNGGAVRLVGSYAVSSARERSRIDSSARDLSVFVVLVEFVVESSSYGRGVLRPLLEVFVEPGIAGLAVAELLLQCSVVGVRAEVLEVACDLGVLRFLTAAPHA